MKRSSFIEKTIAITEELQSTFFKKFFVYDALPSTNATAKELAQKGEPEGTVIISRTQTQGRGRFDRTWQSPDGGLYVSVILRPTVPLQRITLLPLIASLSVATAIDSYGLKTSIKWPNDVRVHQRKIAGILLESEGTSTNLEYGILGIGINVNISQDDFPSDMRCFATSLSNECKKSIDMYSFQKSLFYSINKYYTEFLQDKDVQLMNKWKQKTDTLGKTVEIHTSKEIIIGKACDVDSSGFLIVQTKPNQFRKIMSGDCKYLKELIHTH